MYLKLHIARNLEITCIISMLRYLAKHVCVHIYSDVIIFLINLSLSEITKSISKSDLDFIYTNECLYF